MTFDILLGSHKGESKILNPYRFSITVAVPKFSHYTVSSVRLLSSSSLVVAFLLSHFQACGQVPCAGSHFIDVTSVLIYQF